MKKKIICIFVITLFFATTISLGENINQIVDEKNNIFDKYVDSDYSSGEFIIKIRKDSSLSSPSIIRLNTKYKVKSIEKVFRNAEDTILDNIYLFGVPKDSDVLSIVKDYVSCPDIVYVEPNYILRSCIIPRTSQLSVPLFINELSSNTNPNDPDFNKQWSLNNIGQKGGTPDADVDALEAWGIETGDSDVVIAIIDSGIDYNHPDLSDNIWVNENEIPDNGIDDDENGYVDDIRGWNFVLDNNDPLDGQGHGTLCSGVAAAVSNNSVGISGVCWNCKIMPVQAMDEKGSGNWSDIALGIRYATDNGADVISISLGAYTAPNLLKDAVDYAYSKDIVLVAAAGNDGVSDKWYPAGYDNVIAVASTDNFDKRMDCRRLIFFKYSSNYGDWVDVAAPGVDIYSTMPTYRVTFNYFGLINQNYAYFTGSSFSAPHVAGLAALLLSKNSSLSPEDVKSIICGNVDPYDSEFYIGTGRINAFKALNENILPPNSPITPSGATSGKIGEKYNYTTNTTDPLGDQVYYMWDWGDEVGNWIGPFNSGETVEASYTWTKAGNYEIKVKAKNIGGAESDWSNPLEVTIPRTKPFIFKYNLLNWLLERFPMLEKLLNLLR